MKKRDAPVKYLVNFSFMTVIGSALIDSGTSYNFISINFVEKNGIFKSKLQQKVEVELDTEARTITELYETEKMRIAIGSHTEMIRFLVILELNEENILGKSWMDKHNPLID
jgi:hypothetical protein